MERAGQQITVKEVTVTDDAKYFAIHAQIKIRTPKLSCHISSNT
jgi:hypothetical protein